MRKSITLFVIILCSLAAFPASLWAHVVNENSLYEDIALSKAKEQIVYLSGLGVIAAEHGAPLFKPKDKLTRQELGNWAGAFHKLQAKDPQSMAQAAAERGIVKSLQGNATYEDVSRAFFQGQAAAPKPESELTKEEFALYAAEHWLDKINGRTLFDAAGASAGPSGAIESVSVHEGKDSGGKSIKSFTLTINGADYVLSAHPKILNASVDPSGWKGKRIQQSWLMQAEGNGSQLNLITFEKQQEKGNSDSNPSGGGSGAAHGAHSGHGNSAGAQPVGDGAGFPVLPAAGGLLLILVVIWLFVKKG